MKGAFAMTRGKINILLWTLLAIFTVVTLVRSLIPDALPPLMSVALMTLYERGYFRQALDETGWQRERYPLNDPTRLPLTLERGRDDRPLLVHLELAGEPVALRIWPADLGRTRLYLLDADVEDNSPAARAV